MRVRLIAKTIIADEEIKNATNGDSESLVMYCARVSNPANQASDNPNLLKYCAKAGHWSIFEMSNFVFEIETSRAIAAQILRHRSFSFQELSLRYAESIGFQQYEARRQDTKNRQNSIDDMDLLDKDWFEFAQLEIQKKSEELYKEALRRGVAKEQARFLLPLSTTSRLYMNGNLRSWIHYVSVRTDPSTQKEHREIALAIRDILAEEVPNVAQALGWKKGE